MQRSVGLSRASPDLSMVTILTRPPAQRNAKPISVSAASIHSRMHRSSCQRRSSRRSLFCFTCRVLCHCGSMATVARITKEWVAIPAVADRAGVQSKPQLARHHTAGAFSASSAIPLTWTSGSRWTSLRKESRLPHLSSVSSTFIK